MEDRQRHESTSRADLPLPVRFPSLYAPRDGFVFIVTYGRSGSTLAQAVLNTIPGWCIRGENANALSHVCRMIAELRAEPNLHRRDEGPADPWFGADGVEVDMIARGLMDVFCRKILHLPAGTRVGGFKEIRYGQDLEFLPQYLALMQEFFPRARLIFLTRNAADVARSGWFSQRPAGEVMAQLAETDAAFAAYAAGHRDCFHLTYETLIQGPEALAPLFAFLGEPMDAAAIRRVLAQRLIHAQAPAEQVAG